jgi:hypothetical protein
MKGDDETGDDSIAPAPYMSLVGRRRRSMALLLSTI